MEQEDYIPFIQGFADFEHKKKIASELARDAFHYYPEKQEEFLKDLSDACKGEYNLFLKYAEYYRKLGESETNPTDKEICKCLEKTASDLADASKDLILNINKPIKEIKELNRKLMEE